MYSTISLYVLKNLASFINIKDMGNWTVICKRLMFICCNQLHLVQWRNCVTDTVRVSKSVKQGGALPHYYLAVMLTNYSTLWWILQLDVGWEKYTVHNVTSLRDIWHILLDVSAGQWKGVYMILIAEICLHNVRSILAMHEALLWAHIFLPIVPI